LTAENGGGPWPQQGPPETKNHKKQGWVGVCLPAPNFVPIVSQDEPVCNREFYFIICGEN